jgi:hypothetical protein
MGPEQWMLVDRALSSLVLFVVLAFNTALSFLVAHAVIPSLVSTGDAPPAISGFRRFLYPLFVISLAATLYALFLALSLGVTLIQQIYPRFAI